MKRSDAGFIPLVTLDGQGPLYRQLYGWFQRAIIEGRLKPGQRVASTRALAQELKISRIPVLTAYQQLHAEGYLETFVGAGTCVAASIPQDAFKPPAKTARRPIAARLSQRLDAVLALPPDPQQPGAAFRVSLPALDHFPSEIWSSLLARHSRHPATRQPRTSSSRDRASAARASTRRRRSTWSVKSVRAIWQSRRSPMR